MKHLLSTLMLYAACAALFCSRHPSGPTADPSDVVIELFAGETNCTVATGTPLKMGLAVSHPLFVDTIHLTSGCGDFDTTLSPDLVETADTLYFNPVFIRVGSCTVYAKAILYGAQYGEKTDSLSVKVRAKLPTVTAMDDASVNMKSQLPPQVKMTVKSSTIYGPWTEGLIMTQQAMGVLLQHGKSMARKPFG